MHAKAVKASSPCTTWTFSPAKTQPTAWNCTYSVLEA